jgi:hypothetical protein
MLAGKLHTCCGIDCRAAESKGSAAVAAPQAGNAEPREAHWSQWAMKAAKDALGGSSVAMWVRFTGCLNKQLVSALITIV